MESKLGLRVLVADANPEVRGELIETLMRAGCEVEIHNPLLSLLLGRFSRNHRKILLVDDEIAFLGGINIGDENVDTATERFGLWSLSDSSKDDRVADFEVSAVVAEALADLSGELSGRGQHQDARLSGLPRLRVTSQEVEDGECERGGLAGPGLCDAKQVATLQEVRDRLALDRRWSFIAPLAKCAKDRLHESERYECVIHVLGLAGAPRAVLAWMVDRSCQVDPGRN